MMNRTQIRRLGCAVVIALVAVGAAVPAQANKESTAQKMIKRIEEDIKGYEQKLKAAQERMESANAEGEEVQPLIEPAEKQMKDFKEAMEAQQRKRAAASREMQEKVKADPGIEQARVALEEAEAQRDQLAAELMPGIEAEEAYHELAGKRDAAARRLEKVKKEEREVEVPYAATALAKAQGELGTYVQGRLRSDPAYKAVEDVVSEAQSHRRETEKQVAARYRAEAGLDSMDAVYEDQRDAYRESREALRDLERRFKKLRSDYKDAEKDAQWASRRISIAKSRIEALRR